MTKFFTAISCSLLLLLCSAEAATSVKSNERVDIKCHIALVTGNDTILFLRIRANKKPKLLQRLVGKKVLTSHSTEKIKIYEVFECVLEKEVFASNQAKLLDLKTDR